MDENPYQPLDSRDANEKPVRRNTRQDAQSAIATIRMIAILVAIALALGVIAKMILDAHGC